jgi:nitrite reductase (cytochrome c-552)
MCRTCGRRDGDRAEPYDPNRDATRTEMRSFVCGQCHVEYYCASKMPLTFPWGNGLTADDMETFWNDTKFESGQRLYDYKHAESGAEILKAQHPEFELWSQGSTHAAVWPVPTAIYRTYVMVRRRCQTTGCEARC